MASPSISSFSSIQDAPTPVISNRFATTSPPKLVLDSSTGHPELRRCDESEQKKWQYVRKEALEKEKYEQEQEKWQPKSGHPGPDNNERTQRSQPQSQGKVVQQQDNQQQDSQLPYSSIFRQHQSERIRNETIYEDRKNLDLSKRSTAITTRGSSPDKLKIKIEAKGKNGQKEARFSSDQSTPITVALPLQEESATSPIVLNLDSPTTTMSMSKEEELERTDEDSPLQLSPVPFRTGFLSFGALARSDDSWAFLAMLCTDFTVSLTVHLMNNLAISMRHEVSSIGEWAAASRIPLSSPSFLSASNSKRRNQLQSLQSSSLPRKRINRGVRGIPNYGQTCFLNSVLQSLASCESFVAYLERIVALYSQSSVPFLHDASGAGNNEEEVIPTSSFFASNTLSAEDANQNDSCFTQLLLDTINSINMADDTFSEKRIDPRDLLLKVGEKHKQFQSRYGSFRCKFDVGKEQQDAEEFLQALLSLVVTDAQLDSTSSSLQPSFCSPQPVYGNDEVDSISCVHCDQNEANSRYAVGHESIASPDLDEDDAESVESTLSDEKYLSRYPRQETSHLNRTVQVVDNHFQNHGHDDVCGSNSSASHQREEKKQEDFEMSFLRVGSDVDTSYNSIGFWSEEQHSSQVKSDNRSNKLGSALKTTNGTLKQGKSAKTSPVKQNKVTSEEGSKVTVERSCELASSFCSVGTTDSMSSLKSMQIMMSTMSSITPSPLCGWIGSALQCSACEHIKPISNAPFLDIPIIPTSVPHYSRGRGSGMMSLPPCTLDECLKAFTSVERVHEVECINCTIRKEMSELQQEISMLHYAMDTLQRQAAAKRKQQKPACSVVNNSHENNENFQGLRSELLQAETRLWLLKNMDPDDPEPLEQYFETYKSNKDDLDGLVDMDEEVNVPHYSDSTCSDKLKLQRKDAYKCLLLTRLPAVLCFHIQRRYYDPSTSGMCKTMQHVDFPEILDIGPYCAYFGYKKPGTPWAGRHCSSNSNMSQQQHFLNQKQRNANSIEKINYKLSCIIEHRGNAFAGHYACYRRCPNNDGTNSDKWYCVSDDSVRPIDWSDVRKCQAYMLFYEAM